MDYAYSVFRKAKAIYTAINPATLSGAIDVIVVEQPDGEYKSTPFHVRFGKTGVWSPIDKYVEMDVNGVETDLKMKLGDSGVAYFVESTDGHVPDFLITSPIHGDGHDSPKLPAQVPDTAEILAESAKKLEENQRKMSIVQRRGSHDFPERVLENGEEQSLSSVHKQSIHQSFAYSIFSDRRNRSLPDLRCLLSPYAESPRKTRDDSHASPAKESHKRPLNHSKSQAMDEEGNEDLLRCLLKTKRKKSIRTAPINIKVEDSDSETESSLNSSTVSSPSHSHLDSRDVDLIADGAMSDSEVDRHRHEDQHDERMTDWKWGELPETKDNTPKDTPVNQPRSRWNWYFWRNNSVQQSKQEEGISLDELENNQSDPAKVEKYLGKTGTVSIDSGTASRCVSSPSSPPPHEDVLQAHSRSPGEERSLEDQTPTQETINLPGTKPKQRLRSSGSAASHDTLASSPLSEEDLESVEEEDGVSYFRSLRLSSNKLKSLGLRFGANECRFSITTMYQGTTWCTCNIYLYKYYEQIVISDIDGTITKSDVLGHVIPAIGGQWAHSGVADLYTRIKNNGYKMVYLSSRAIGQSHTTKQYLRSVAQDSKQLPDGPVLLSPSSVLMAFRKEVIERRPEEFKIAALSDLKKLFPANQPFFAGFGNRETDTKSYRAVEIPPSRILIVDPSGRVRTSDSVGYVSSYNSMASDTVDYLFPPVSKNVKYMRGAYPSNVDTLQRSSWYQPLEHSAFMHWKTEADADEVDAELAAYEVKRVTKK